MYLVRRSALDVNPPAGDQQLSVNGSNWLWTVMAIYLLSFLVIVALSYRPFQQERIFHFIFSTALLIGGICYFSAAADLSYVVIPTANNLGRGASYQVFWAKYINWIVSFAAIIVSLGLLSGVSWATIFYTVGLSWIWVVSYLVSAFTATKYKWGFFVLGTVAHFLLAGLTLFHFRKRAAGVSVGSHYTLLAGWVNFLWLLYPIAFGLTDGGNRIGVTPAWIFFGILDVLMLPVLAFAFATLSRRWDYERLNMSFTRHGRVGDVGTYQDKTPAPVAGGVTV